MNIDGGGKLLLEIYLLSLKNEVREKQNNRGDPLFMVAIREWTE